jgi:hypothetical protein
MSATQHDELDVDARVREVLPPERLLEDSTFRQITAAIACMQRIETVQQYIGYENTHQQRIAIIQSLRFRVLEIRQETESDSGIQ